MTDRQYEYRIDSIATVYDRVKTARIFYRSTNYMLESPHGWSVITCNHGYITDKTLIEMVKLVTNCDVIEYRGYDTDRIPVCTGH